MHLITEKTKEELINDILLQAKYFLNAAGEFYPFGTVIDKSYKLKPISFYGGEEYPESTDVLRELEESIKKGIAISDYLYAAIGLDVYITVRGEKKNAIEIRIYDSETSLNEYFLYDNVEDNYTFKAFTDKRFVSNNGWFSLTLPANWEEYDDGEDGTYAFFNANIWTGNFRITPLRWTESVDPDEDKAGQFIEAELSSNSGATKIMLGDFDCAHYKKNILQGEDEFLMYYWATGKSENLFICSFTINKEKEWTSQNINELKIVEDIIKSIEIH